MIWTSSRSCSARRTGSTPDLKRWRELKMEDRRQRRNGRANDRHGEKRSSRNGIHRRQGRARLAPDRPERNRNQETDRAREESSEEDTSELQSLLRNSYAVFSLINKHIFELLIANILTNRS